MSPLVFYSVIPKCDSPLFLSVGMIQFDTALSQVPYGGLFLFLRL